MKFHFEFDIKRLPRTIKHPHKLFLIGSCFTENMGEKLKRYKFQVLENPNGILFNPVSVAEAIEDYIDNTHFSLKDVFNYNEGWHSWKHHSRFSGLTADESLDRINASVASAHAYLKDADHIIITLGSAWIYELTKLAVNPTPGTVAANNHKAPAEWFNRRLMNVDEVIMILKKTVERLTRFNPDLQFIFTISPVRHLREGVVENNRSKSTLILAVHQLMEKFERIYYFPSYELMIDDLRDYRFYSEDLVHPNYYATEYLWEKFIQACMDEKTKILMEEIHAINLAYKHRPFNPSSAQHKKFLQSSFQKIKEIKQQHSYLDFDKELDYFSTSAL